MSSLRGTSCILIAPEGNNKSEDKDASSQFRALHKKLSKKVKALESEQA